MSGPHLIWLAHLSEAAWFPGDELERMGHNTGKCFLGDRVRLH